MLQNIGRKWELTKPGVLPSPLIQRGGEQTKKIAEDAEKQLFERLSESLWRVIQVDEPTDAEN